MKSKTKPPFDCTGEHLQSNVLWLNPDNQKPTNSMRKGRREKDIDPSAITRGGFCGAMLHRAADMIEKSPYNGRT